ncbi:EFR1 family ferrodoxin [Clostridioides difficile]|uniref:EFR1 family ferrodoxin n=1 Tax=Clostridioides difficile TaxID=1496 RepID=UPI00097FDE58|nr:EFR1 family ferrodoxin [Clostridioides difficile]SJT04924.1 Ferredoxin II [Clostridioides difficile]SJT11207.1 Ferredoxin II [Clostridioides difficile]SJT57726.1 Ferredoxin II [Clostridioides difficile]
MILYFSGTGNSRYVARKIAQELNDELTSLNQLIKEEKTDELISVDKPFIFVCPTYAWRLPIVVTDFIKKTKFLGSNRVYFVMTCGGDTAKSINYIQKLCKYKEWQLKGMAEIKMPENYIALFSTTDKETSKQMIKEADKQIYRIISDIRNENEFETITPSGLGGTIKSSIINTVFYKTIISAKGFHYTDKCIGCGKCVELCPLNNINLKNKKPVWKNNCTHCMACICGCPTEAIEYKNKTQNRERYYLE